VNRTYVPDEILAAAHARARARADRDWAEADRLRGQIEAAGWTVVDRGTDFALSPAHPPDVSDGGRVRYGSSSAVPSRLDEAIVATATVILVATDRPSDLERTLAGLRQHAPDGTQVVVAANAPSAEQEAALDALESLDPGLPGVRTEVVWTSARLGHAAAINAACRRASGGAIILLDTSVEPVGDLVTPLVAALDDPAVAVVGARGVTSADFRRFEDAPAGEVDAVDGSCMAFRREDFGRRGPLDEHFHVDSHLATWWSLVLRDEGEDQPPRRARALADLPIVRHERDAGSGLPAQDSERLGKRNFYRVLDRFRTRRDLLTAQHNQPDSP
jgi:hypothetical protein